MVDLTRYWYRPSLHPITFCLLPFSWFFRMGVALRRWLYDVGLIKIQCFSMPIVVVGNITVGGTGKTPFVIWLVKFLQMHGFNPGIVTRGVGGKKHVNPYLVQAQDKPETVGDEAILLLQNTQCPVCIGIDRVAVVKKLLEYSHCDVIIADDGLQHYHLGRDIEIAMIDSERGFGNGFMLPAGPLREPVKRLNKIDFIISNGDENNEFSLLLMPDELISLKDSQQRIKLTDFPHPKVHAVAGIGNPSRFFNVLRKNGLEVIEHVFPDHHLYQPHELNFPDAYPILMTEKDAVKCKHFSNEHSWYLSITAKINSELEKQILKKINSICEDV